MNDFFVGVPFTDCEKVLLSKNLLIATREDEAVGIAAGAWLCGKKPLVFMQNSGLGNCGDVITSLLKPYKIDVAFLINIRKTPEHHKIMGRITKLLMKIFDYKNVTFC